jgi:hypothetical protein
VRRVTEAEALAHWLEDVAHDEQLRDNRIAAMEALVLGVPVVIANKNSTDFFELNSIIDFRELENAIKLYDKDKFIHYISQLKMQANQNMSIAKHNFSIGNYINNLVQVALSIREYKKI